MSQGESEEFVCLLRRASTYDTAIAWRERRSKSRAETQSFATASRSLLNGLTCTYRAILEESGKVYLNQESMRQVAGGLLFTQFAIREGHLTGEIATHPLARAI